MRVTDLGEKKLVRIARRILSDPEPRAGVVVGMGDDAAAVEPPLDLLLVSSDMVFSGTHFPRGSPPRLCGWYAAAVNLSDIAAKGGTPIYMILDIAMPGDLPFHWFEEVLKGFGECCSRYGVPVVGGDTKYAPALIMAPTVLGRIDRKKFIPRGGAGPGELVYITGTLGGSAAALSSIDLFQSPPHLRRSCSVPDHAPDNAVGSGYRHVEETGNTYRFYKKVLRVEPRLAAGRVLSESGLVTSCMDVSDGLASSLYELAEASGVGFSVDAAKLPVDPLVGEVIKDVRMGIDTALYSGGDFGLLFTVKSGGGTDIKRMFGEAGLPVPSVIGEVMENEMKVVVDGQKRPLERKGWEHLTE